MTMDLIPNLEMFGRSWDEAGKQWWFAVVDVVEAVSGSKEARNYWNALKSRFRKTGSETLTKCKRFRLV